MTIIRTHRQPRTLLLTLDTPPGATGWPGPLAAQPCLGGWLERAAQGAWADNQTQAEPWSASLAALIKAGTGPELGLLNLPGFWPPPAIPGWCLPRPPARDNRAHRAHPPELATESADLIAGLTWFAGRRPARAHERDNRLAEAGACAWLVREHALRLAAVRPVAWLGVGFMGLGEAWDLSLPQAGNLFFMLLEQIDDHAVHLARSQRPDLVMLLTGAGWAVRGAGRVKPGRVDGLDPAAVVAFLALVGGLGADAPPYPALAPALVGLLALPEF